MPYTSSSNYPSISMDEEVDRILESWETEFASSVDTTALCESEVDDCFDYDFHRKELQARRNERICINLALPESRTRSFEDWPTYGAAFLREGTFSQRFLTETPPKHTYAKKRHIEVTWQAGFREPVVSICSESPKTGNLVFCGEDSRETAKTGRSQCSFGALRWLSDAPTGDGYFRAHALDCVNFRWSGDTECIVKWKPIKRALHKSQWDDNHCISEANRRRTARILQAVYVFHSGKVKSTTWDTSAGRLMTIALSRPRMYPNGRIAPHFDLRQESLGRMERNQQLAARDDLMSMAWRPACEESVPTFGTSILAELDPMTCRSSELHAVAALVNKADKMVNLDHLTTKDFQLVGESGSRARHLRPDCLWTDALAMNQVSKCDERRTLLREVAEMLRIFNGGGAEANTRDNNHLKALLPGSRVSIERSFAKAGILLFSPVCLHVSRNYAVSREFSPPANTTWFYQYIGDDIQVSRLTWFARCNVYF